MDAGCKQNYPLSYCAQDHRNDKYWSPAISIRIGWEYKKSNKHTNHITRTNEPNIFRRLAQKIKLLNPIINIFGICLIIPIQVFIEIQIIFTNKLLRASFPSPLWLYHLRIYRFLFPLSCFQKAFHRISWSNWLSDINTALVNDS